MKKLTLLLISAALLLLSACTDNTTNNVSVNSLSPAPSAAASDAASTEVSDASGSQPDSSSSVSSVQESAESKPDESSTALKAPNTVILIDEADIFSEEEEKSITELIKKTSEDIGFEMEIYIGGKDLTDAETELFVKNRAEAFSGTDGAVCLYIDMDGQENAYDYMYATNDAFLYYTNGDNSTEPRIDIIIKAMQEHLPAGGEAADSKKVIEGIEAFCGKLKEYKNAGKAAM